MTLRGVFFCGFAALSIGAVGALWAFDTLAINAVVSGPTAMFLLACAAFVNIGVLAAVGILFLILARSIARPVRELSDAAAAFAKDGSHLPVSVSRATPREVRTLAANFANLIATLETEHTHDADISRMKSDFISTAAHQIRTPLTGIRWALEALAKSGLTQDQKPLVDNAVEKSHELVEIIKTLLDISSIESGKYQYKFEPVDLAKMAQQVTRDMAPMAAERQVSATFYNEQPVPPVRADEERVRWIVNNLVENALRYTPAGGSVRVWLERLGDRALLKVSDTGIGIKPEDRANIFSRFYRGENARAKESAGNGLGLYIARNIAKDHGGDLNFADNPSGQGTTFTLSLPLARG